MRRRIFWTTAAIALVALMAAVPLAFAQRARAMHGGDGAFGGPMIFGHLRHAQQTLGLSDQQVSDIRAIFKDLRQQNQTYRQSMHSTMQQVAEMLIKNPNDVAAAQALLDRQMENERALRNNALTAASKALNVLTPDQRGKLDSLLQEHINRRQQN
jgi:Spy/CpxP family protein refolding chaperone